MDQIEFPTAERATLHDWRFHHPHPRVQRPMAALDLQSHGLAPAASCPLCAIAQPTFSRDLHASRAGGLEQLTAGSVPRRQSLVADDRTRIAAAWRPRPPARVAEAAARIATRTGPPAGTNPGASVLQVLREEPPPGRADSRQSRGHRARSLHN